jgi:hypothetical protein
MMIECPHCHSTVWPRTDGTCPSCQQDTRDTRGADLTKAVMTITAGQATPWICHSCGSSTDRYVKVHRTSAKGTDDEGAATSKFLGIALGLLVGHLFFWNRSRDRLVVAIPQCPTCAAQHGPPAPRYVDFDRQRMTFVVDRAFKEAADRGDMSR